MSMKTNSCAFRDTHTFQHKSLVYTSSFSVKEVSPSWKFVTQLHGCWQLILQHLKAGLIDWILLLFHGRKLCTLDPNTHQIRSCLGISHPLLLRVREAKQAIPVWDGTFPYCMKHIYVLNICDEHFSLSTANSQILPIDRNNVPGLSTLFHGLDPGGDLG